MDPFDLDVRRAVYAHVVGAGGPPSVAETAATIGCDADEAAAAYRRLHDAHAIVLFPESVDIWMANPFCFGSTPHRVIAAGRMWAGTCAWDSLGIPAALWADGLVESECACCGSEIELEVVDGRLVRGADVLVHFLVPARRWWDDIGFT